MTQLVTYDITDDINSDTLEYLLANWWVNEFKASNGLVQSVGIIGAITGAARGVSLVSESMSTS